MDTASPVDSNLTLAEVLDQYNVFAPLLVLATAVLLAWGWSLFRGRPASEYLVFLAATIWPFWVGIWGAASRLCTMWHELQFAGKGIDTDPSWIMRPYIGEILNLLWWGSCLTCVFFALGVALYKFRSPK